MTRVAIACCRAEWGGDPARLYPDPDGSLLTDALVGAGCEAVAVAWDTPEVDWGGFDVVAIRNTWDSVDRPRDFLAWANVVATLTTLVNPLAAVEWNLDKRYLRVLEAAGVPVVPTQWITGEGDWEPPAGHFVVKPLISGGGRRTARYRPDQREAASAHVARLVGEGHAAMIQPYVAEVDREGETKLVLIEGEFSHAVRVGPLLHAGRVPTERPWEEPVSVEPTVPTADELELARETFDTAQAAVGAPLAYARVDVLGRRINEIELIDPVLMLRHAPPAAPRLARALVAPPSRRGVRGWRA